MWNKLSQVALLLSLVVAALSCEIDTKLAVKGVPPQFHMSGSGELGRLVVRGRETQRDIEGPDASAYWYIRPQKGGGGRRNVGELSPVTYGVVPEGYEQLYPENGQAPPKLAEGQRFYVQVDTVNANGASLWFIIRKGKVEFSEYEHSLKEN